MIPARSAAVRAAASSSRALHAAPIGVAKDTRGDIEAGFVAQARFRTTHRPTAGFRRNGDRREAVNLEGKLDAGEQVRRTVFFGYHRFPIVRVLDGGD